MSEVYTIVLYTTALEQYAQAILKFLGIEKFFSLVLHREHCHLIDSKWVKDLSLLSLPMKDVILLDDLVLHARFNPENVLVVRPYRGEKFDNDLSTLSEFLLEIAEARDCRPVMKKFTAFQARKDENKFHQKDQVLRSIATKFMQRLRMSGHKKSTSVCERLEYDFDNIDEDVSMLPPSVIEIHNSSKILKALSNEKSKNQSVSDTSTIDMESDSISLNLSDSTPKNASKHSSAKNCSMDNTPKMK